MNITRPVPTYSVTTVSAAGEDTSPDIVAPPD
jgi:hypothetical protein